MIFTETFTVEPVAPFNFDLTAHIFSSGDKQIRNFVNGKFHQVLRINGNLVLVKLTSKGSIQKPKLSIELKSNAAIDAQVTQAAKKNNQVHFQLRL
jgi:uncharacterized protein YgiM (DUF1202 family)